MDAYRSVVDASDLEKRYDDLVAVDRITFAVKPGECFGFLGPNGAGKTTTMKMIYCVLPPTDGRLSVLGMNVRAHGRVIKSRLGVVTQDNTLDTALSVRENLMIFARYFDLSWPVARRRADALLEFVALADRAQDKVEQLSGGMKRRLMVARALLPEPDLLLLDEPTTGLDPQARQLTWEKLRQLKRTGVTQILTTQYMEEAAALCDRIVIMDQGRFVAEGAPAQLIQQHIGRDVVELHGFGNLLQAPRGRAWDAAAIGHAALAPVLQAAGDLADGHEVLNDQIILYTQDGEGLLRRIKEGGVTVDTATLRRATLEDVFLKLTGRLLRD
jgi:lipooligosaccharide transport system ATP-binding protein